MSSVWPDTPPSAKAVSSEPRHDKANKMSVRPAKTRISLGIRPVWSESSLCAQWVAKDPSFRHVDSKDSDQTGRMPRLIWVFAWRTYYFVGFVVLRLKLVRSRNWSQAWNSGDHIVRADDAKLLSLRNMQSGACTYPVTKVRKRTSWQTRKIVNGSCCKNPCIWHLSISIVNLLALM